jgi:hypothetical protein
MATGILRLGLPFRPFLVIILYTLCRLLKNYPFVHVWAVYFNLRRF